MKISKYKVKNKNQYIVYGDKEEITLYTETIMQYNLINKKVVSDDLLKEIKIYDKNYQAYYEALKQLTRKLQTEQEIRNKLKKKNYLDINIDLAITKLEKLGYLNKDLYLRSYINDQINLSLKGPKKIIKELEKLGYNEEDINKYLDEYNDIWYERIKKIIDKKIKSNHTMSGNILKNKIERDLINLGYSNFASILQGINFLEDEKIISKEYTKLLKKYQNKYEGKELEFKIKRALYQKGFSYENIENIMKI